MTQTREKWDCLFGVELTLEWRYEDAIVFRVFIFIFLFKTTGKKKHLDEDDFCPFYGNFFGKCRSESYLIITLFKVLSQQLWTTLTTAFERHFKMEDFTEMDHHTCSFFVGKKSWNENWQRCLKSYRLHKKPSLCFKEHCSKK